PVGVNIFFVLSGFVLFLPYCLKRRRMDSLSDVKAFYWHRAFRLLPLYYIVVLVTLTLHAHSPAGHLRWFLELGGLTSTLFIFSPHGFLPPSNVVLWSVAVEIWFSVLFPFLVMLVNRWRLERVVLVSLILGVGGHIIGHAIPVAGV